MGIITEPRNNPEAVDWMFWREDNGVHAERLAHGSIYLASDMRSLLDSILSEWLAPPKQRGKVIAGTGLPAWLHSGVGGAHEDHV